MKGLKYYTIAAALALSCSKTANNNGYASENPIAIRMDSAFIREWNEAFLASLLREKQYLIDNQLSPMMRSVT